MLSCLCNSNQTLRSRFINQLREALYNKEDFTQGEYIEALDYVQDTLKQDTSVNLEKLDEIAKSLTLEWKDIGEIIRNDNQTKRVHSSLAIIIGVTALVTGIIMWLLMKKK